MKIKIWALSTCIPERGEGPCMPHVFGSEAEADAMADEMLRAEWQHNAPCDDKTGEPLPYPGDWREANNAIAAGIDDGSWGQWEISAHEVEIADPDDVETSHVPSGFDKAIEEAMQNKHRDLAQRIRDERRMARALVDAALERGYAVSVNDGEEWVVNWSTDKDEIMGALFSTDEDVIMICIRSDGLRSLGRFKLIYGNDGYDVVSDFSDNAACNAIWNDVLQPLADKIEEGR